MKVYRLLSEEELNLLLNGQGSSLGNYFNDEYSNTHRYKSGEKYLHFFFRKQDCEYIKEIQDNLGDVEEKYIAEFKIPLSKIIGHIGRGFYHSKYTGLVYDTCYEIAIPMSIFNPNWLVKYDKLELDLQVGNHFSK